MDLSAFDYPLPGHLIAQAPCPRRDESRLLTVNRADGSLREGRFRDILAYLTPGDALILNNTYVFPARLLGRKDPGGAAIEMLLLEPRREGEWEVIAYRASRLKRETRVVFSDSFSCTVIKPLGEGKFLVRFAWEGDWDTALAAHGQVPLPPYITRPGDRTNGLDRERYQTIYARRFQPYESAAAPTAGLHFTQDLLESLREKGIRTGEVTLRIGLDTFLPLRVDKVEDHVMHTEAFYVPPETAALVSQTKARGGRIIAVGTTAVRVLETAATPEGGLTAGEGKTNLFIYPGYSFKIVEGLITNFHLPRSTLLLLVSAFMGNELRQKAYAYAAAHEFRFYSYGDAMLIF
ncbi:MAG: tRNA preQ1(34) S-adenosylmethionine ribosyltransferase-isomerase QueA [Candidatus Omnitrophica bacterium]|nr:tRNA preQ1(34) S-adenosylmethionine ribosyltransferase-isomerase QueA [Candidatus Omnitrophota bacterium]